VPSCTCQAIPLLNIKCIGLARTIYTRCIYSVFCRTDQIYGHIRRVYTMLANPTNARTASQTWDAALAVPSCTCQVLPLMNNEYTQSMGMEISDVHIPELEIMRVAHNVTILSEMQHNFSEQWSGKIWACLRDCWLSICSTTLSKQYNSLHCWIVIGSAPLQKS